MVLPTQPFNHALKSHNFHTEKLKANVNFIAISLTFKTFTKLNTNAIFKINFMKFLVGTSKLPIDGSSHTLLIVHYVVAPHRPGGRTSS